MAETGIFERLDADQLRAVLLKVNAAVSAGAGSGKTTVLAARYLRLVLEEGADVRSILCLTFTRKAAAEMRERIYRELLASKDPRARSQVERFAEAHISTLDSFCSLLLRSSAQDYGFPPDFSIDDASSREIAEKEALAFLLEKREEDPLPRVFAHLGFETAWRSLFADIAYRLCSPAGGAESDFRGMAARTRRALAEEAMEAAKAAAACFDAVRVAAAEATKIGKKATEALALAERIGPPLEALLEGPGLDPEAAGRLLEPLAAFVMGNFGAAGEEIKEAMNEGREAARRMATLASASGSMPLVEATFGFLDAFGERYRRAKRSAGIMGFRDAAQCAVDLLARRSEVRAWWKRRFRFIMIDEFQDDDELQRKLLYLLAEREELDGAGLPTAGELAGDKLFFVGDEKQSIYRFRGADVSVFNRLRRELPEASRLEASAQGTAPEDMPRLRMNYRSEPGLVAFFNETFARVFAGASKDYEARFEDIGARPATRGLESDILYLMKRRGGASEGMRSDDEALAEAIARFIEDSVGKLKVARGDKGISAKGEEEFLRPAEYDDFAILLRSTSKQYILERFLRLHGIPYTAADVRGLFVESPANDMHAALRLALLDDPVSYAIVLRSPLVRLSDDAFVRVLAAGLPAFAPDTETVASLTAPDAARFARGRELLQGIRDRADRVSAARLVSWIWYEAGLRLSILRLPGAHPYLEHFDYLFALAARSDAKGEGLAAFIAGLEPLMGLPEKVEDLEVPREAAVGVRIMTIHKSKGLEFPIVILPGMEGRGGSEGAGAAWYAYPPVGVTLNFKPWDEPDAGKVNPFYDKAKEEDAAKKGAELKRLFYVACTRASSRLVFAGIEPKAKDMKSASFHALLCGGDGLAEPDGSFAGMNAAVRLVEVPDLREEAYLGLFSGNRALSLESRLPAYETARSIDRSYARTRLSVSELDAARRRSLPTPASAETDGEILPACAADAFTDRVPEHVFGSICHSVLETALARPGNSPAKGQIRLPDSLLSLVPEELRAGLLAEAGRLTRGFLDSGLGARLLAGAKISTETGFILDIGEGFSVQGRIDLLAESEGAMDVVDFKSDRRRRKGEHEFQLALYRRAAAAFAPGSAVRSWIFWLRDSLAEEVLADFSDGDIRSWARCAAQALPGDDAGEGEGS